MKKKKTHHLSPERVPLFLLLFTFCFCEMTKSQPFVALSKGASLMSIFLLQDGDNAGDKLRGKFGGGEPRVGSCSLSKHTDMFGRKRGGQFHTNKLSNCFSTFLALLERKVSLPGPSFCCAYVHPSDSRCCSFAPLILVTSSFAV